ncbi:MAG: sulfite exporter TauE/SafE family protein [Methylobacillus sp.]|jgi:uncharacterized membrane protein YfcA|nr:sulfite exporter TauE/SafE family protein [Methylobacillus sp.]
MDFGYIISGFMVGLLVGVTGVGGGSLMTPLLVFAFGFKPVVAVGTDLLFAAITKSGGVLVHHGNHKSVEWRIVGLLAAGSLPAALAALYVLHHFTRLGADITPIITHALGIALILTSLALFFRAWLQRKAQKTAWPWQPDGDQPERFHRWQAPATIVTGLVLGVLVTLSSVGAGALGTVALLFLYPRLPTVKIVGTDIAHAIPLTAIGGFGHWQMGAVDFTLLGSLLIGSLPGIWIGSHLSSRIPEKFLRPVLASVLMLIGLKFVF